MQGGGGQEIPESRRRELSKKRICSHSRILSQPSLYAFPMSLIYWLIIILLSVITVHEIYFLSTFELWI